MAKRVRSRSTHRPGGQGPSRTSKTPDASTPVTGDASEATTDVDAALMAEDIGAEYTELAIDESAAPVAAAAPADKKSRRRARRRTKARPDDLASRASAETVWVRGDLRRIGLVSVVLITALAVAWLVFGVMDVLGLY